MQKHLILLLSYGNKNSSYVFNVKNIVHNKKYLAKKLFGDLAGTKYRNFSSVVWRVPDIYIAVNFHQ